MIKNQQHDIFSESVSPSKIQRRRCAQFLLQLLASKERIPVKTVHSEVRDIFFFFLERNVAIGFLKKKHIFSKAVSTTNLTHFY